jgi:hypothetical protein
MNLVPTLEEEEEYTIYAVNKLRKQYEKGISTQAKENPKAGIILNQKQMNWFQVIPALN